MKMNIRVRGIHWQKIRIKHTQMNATYYLEPGCAILHYFYFHHLKLLFDVLLVLVRKYGQKQVSRTVLWVLQCTGAITHEFSGAQPKIQSHMRPVSR